MPVRLINKCERENQMGENKNISTEELAVQETREESYKSGSVQYIDSREVAEMIGKRHPDLKRDIKRYIGQLDMSKIAHIDFFSDSTYRDSENREQSCYLVTLKGCEFIAHKLTGQKGTEFTARYINRFHEMKDELTEGTPVSVGQFNQLYDAVIVLTEEFQKLKELVVDKLDNDGMMQPENKSHACNPYSFDETAVIEERKKELYRLTAKVAELCGVVHTSILHQMYRALEERLEIVLDSYKSVYRSETGRERAGMVEVIAANSWLYENAVELNKFAIEKRQVYA